MHGRSNNTVKKEDKQRVLVDKQRVLVIDNYDSFTFNLVQLIGLNNHEVIICKNDEITRQKILSLNPGRILISPGPGRPEDSKGSLKAVELFFDKIPILGVCLGHQVIGLVLGCSIIKAPVPVHGKVSQIYHDRQTIFQELKSPITATRYHSLLVDKGTVSDQLQISAETADGLIMGMRHKEHPVEGIQFHPESILTKTGEKIISNWLGITA